MKIGVIFLELKDLLEKLKKNGYKITEQRKAILCTLVHNKNTLMSVEQLLSHAQKINYNTNMSTVYRNLEILEKLDLLYKITMDTGITFYKLICSYEHHHHIICKKCGKTEKINYCPINKFEEISEEKKFRLTEHKLELYGYCHDCLQEDD